MNYESERRSLEDLKQQARQQYNQSSQQYYDPFSDPFGFWGSQNDSQQSDWQQTNQNGWQTWYTYRSSDEEQDGSDAPGGYRWTYHRTRRRGNFLVRLLGIYLLIQIVAMLFGSCGYRGAYYDPYYYRNYSYSDSGIYSGQSQSQTDSVTDSGSWY